jgi:hypothetical protein
VTTVTGTPRRWTRRGRSRRNHSDVRYGQVEMITPSKCPSASALHGFERIFGAADAPPVGSWASREPPPPDAASCARRPGGVRSLVTLPPPAAARTALRAARRHETSTFARERRRVAAFSSRGPGLRTLHPFAHGADGGVYRRGRLLVPVRSRVLLVVPTLSPSRDGASNLAKHSPPSLPVDRGGLQPSVRRPDRQPLPGG